MIIPNEKTFSQNLKWDSIFEKLCAANKQRQMNKLDEPWVQDMPDVI